MTKENIVFQNFTNQSVMLTVLGKKGVFDKINEFFVAENHQRMTLVNVLNCYQVLVVVVI